MTKPLYGLMAEFETADELVHACEAAHAEGYRKMDAYSPLPIEELHHALHIPDTPLPKFVLAGGLAGMVAGMGLLQWISNIAYPYNVGGRPLNSWPSFIPITFELTVLFAGLTTLVTLVMLCGLPMPYHPVFNVPRFKSASRDGFFFCIEAEDPRFDLQRTKEFLNSLRPSDVSEVEQ
ncbi:MAG: DUF3341 domain-containing protein [Candidatus Solibacter usitatus]|nr:DUF3341 domain-containing protein [Candidatus Solibacter usitatus]